MKQNNGQPHKISVAKINLIFLFIAAIICGLILQAGSALEKTVLTPDFYQELIDDPFFHEQIWGQLWQGLTGQKTLPDTDSAVFSAFRSSFNERWLEDQLGQALAGALSFVKGADRQLVITLNIKEQKEIFRRELLRLTGQPADSRLAAHLEKFLQKEVLPDQHLLLSITGPADLSPGTAQSLADFQSARLRLKYASYAAYGLLFPIALFWGGPGSGLKWYGAGIFASGLILAVFIITILHKPAIFQSYLPGLPAKFLDLARAPLIRNALLQAGAGLAIMGAGWGLFWINKHLGSRKRAEPSGLK